MEMYNNFAPTRNQKRKYPEIYEDESSIFPLNELNQDLLERVLSWLPTSSFFRLTSVSKRWKSMAESPTFRLNCSQVPTRDPWFLMVDSKSQFTNNQHQPIVVLDSAEKNWKKLNQIPLLQQNRNDFVPVSSSGGLLCFHSSSSSSNDFIITNPVSGSCQQLTSLHQIPKEPIHAIAMMSKPDKFNLVLVLGELPNLKFRQYNTTTNKWEEETTLTRKKNNSTPVFDSQKDDNFTQYFLSKCGNVVSADIQRSPCKRFSSVLTVDENGDEILCFLSSSGTVVSCNLSRKFFFEYPRLLPYFCEYSIDLVECGGEMCVVLLSEFFESASVRVWKWDEGNQSWQQIAAMPPWMSHKFYDKNVDINCSGAGEKMLICFNSDEICSYVLCDLVTNEWIELPQCHTDDKVKEFVCGFSFEPRIEAKIREN